MIGRTSVVRASSPHAADVSKIGKQVVHRNPHQTRLVEEIRILGCETKTEKKHTHWEYVRSLSVNRVERQGDSLSYGFPQKRAASRV